MLKVNLAPQITKPEDKPAISNLCSQAFGPGRFARTAFRLRENYTGYEDFGLCVWSNDELVGSITFTPVKVNKADGVFLLGPLAVRPDYAGCGYGVRLIEDGCKLARERGCDVVLLVGDLSYYGRLGFQQVRTGQFIFPGPVDPARILVKELQPDAVEKFQGRIHV